MASLDILVDSREEKVDRGLAVRERVPYSSSSLSLLLPSLRMGYKE